MSNLLHQVCRRIGVWTSSPDKSGGRKVALVPLSPSDTNAQDIKRSVFIGGNILFLRMKLKRGISQQKQKKARPIKNSGFRHFRAFIGKYLKFWAPQIPDNLIMKQEDLETLEVDLLKLATRAPHCSCTFTPRIIPNVN